MGSKSKLRAVLLVVALLCFNLLSSRGVTTLFRLCHFGGVSRVRLKRKQKRKKKWARDLVRAAVTGRICHSPGKIVPDICFGEEGLFIVFYLDIFMIQVVQLQTAEYHIEALTSREPTERLLSLCQNTH